MGKKKKKQNSSKIRTIQSKYLASRTRADTASTVSLINRQRSTAGCMEVMGMRAQEQDEEQNTLTDHGHQGKRALLSNFLLKYGM